MIELKMESWNKKKQKILVKTDEICFGSGNFLMVT